MKIINIVNHDITSQIDDVQEKVAQRLLDEFQRFGVERDIVFLREFAEELIENTDKTIYTCTYQLEFLADALFTILIKAKAFTEKDAKELWLAAQEDEDDSFNKFYDLLKFLLKKGE